MVLPLGLGKRSPCLAQRFKGTHSSIFWLCPYTLGKELVGLRGHAHLEPVPLLLDHPPGIWDPAQMAPNLPSGPTQAFFLVCFPKGPLHLCVHPWPQGCLLGVCMEFGHTHVKCPHAYV